MLVIDTPKPLQTTIRKNLRLQVLCLVLGPALCTGPLLAQTSSIPVDSAAQASPLVDPPGHSPVDASVTSSPIPPAPTGDSILPGSQLQIQLSRALNSATAHNGDRVPGLLQAPVRTASGHILPAGTAVTALVISAAPAGVVTSAGELSLQIVRVGSVPVFSNILERLGETGHRDMPDSAPAKGTEATVAAGVPLRFSIPPVPGV